MAGSNGATFGGAIQLPGTITSLALTAVNKAGNDIPGLSRALGNALFDEVVFDSQFSPEYSMQPWAPGDGQPGTPPSALPGAIGNYVRGRIRLRKGGQTVATFAPHGEPNGNWLPNGVGAVSAVVAVTAFALGAKKTAGLAALLSAAGFGIGYVTRPR